MARRSWCSWRSVHWYVWCLNQCIFSFDHQHGHTDEHIIVNFVVVIFTQCVRLGGKAVSINEFQKTKWFDKSRHLNYRDTGISVREVLAVPMFDVNGSILGVLEVINKKNEGLGFNQKDLRMLTAVTSHISLTVQGPGSSLRYDCTLRVRFQICEPRVFV